MKLSVRSATSRRSKGLVVAAAAAAAVSATWAPVARAQTYTLDPAKVGAQPWDTSTAIWDNGTNTPGAYDDLFANGASATSVIALLNSSAATTLTTAGTITLNQIQFAGANPNTTVAGTVSFLGTGTNTIDVVGGGTGTISAAVTAGTGLTKTGSGTLVLSGTNAITGGLTVTGGTVNYGAEGNLGGSGVTLNGGGVAYTGGNYTPTKAITVGAAGGTFNLTTNVKITGSLAGFITSATGTTGTLTRAGAANNVGNNFSLSGANSGFAGAWNFTGGVTEATSAAALGSSASTNTLTLNAGAELAASATTITQNLTINGGTLGGDNGTSTYSGAVTVNGPFNVRLGDFYQANVGRNLIISGPMTGTGAITLLSSNTYTAATVGAGQTLFLNGNNSGYTSSFNFVPGFNVAFGTAASVGTGTVTINSNASGLGGVGYGYDFGAVVPTFTNNRTGTTTGGVFGINTTLAATTTLDLSTLGGGGMYLGSQGTGTYAAATLTPDGTVYRLGGGGGTLTIANGVLVGANTVQIGDPLTATTTRANGAGTVVLAAANSYTGTTNIATGSVLSITNGGALGSTAAGTTAAAGGALSLSNNIVVAGEALTINGVVSTAAQTAGLVSAGGNNVFTANITANNTGTDNVRIASNTSAATLTLPGNIVTANAATSLVLQGAGNIVQTGVISGPAGLISTNSGAIYLSGANTYAGRTNVQTGRVLVTQIGNVGAAASNLGAQSTAASATIDLGNSPTTGTLVYLGTAGETTDRQVRLIGTTGGGTLEQAGGGLLKFTTALAAPGTAAADNRKTLTLAGSSAGTGEFAGAIVDSALGTAGQLATSVAKTGTGTWTLSGANTYTGTTTAGGGNLVLNFAAATAPATATNLVAAASPLAFSGGTLTVNGSAATATSQIFASTALNLGGGSIGLVNNGPGTVVNLGAITRATGGSLDILQPTGALSATNGVTTTTANNAAGILGGYATVGGTDWAVSGGSATNPVTAYSGYTTLTASGGGTQTTTNFLQVGAQALTAAVTANSLKITDTTTGAALDVGANNVTLNGAAGGLLYVPGAAGNSYTVSGTGTVGAGAANEFVVSVAAGGTLSISAPIIGAGAGGLTKTGPGTLVLSNAANAYTGPINVVGGVLSAAVANQNNPTTETASILGAAGARTITLNNGGTFQLTGANVLNPKAATKAFAIGSGGGTFDIPTAGGQITLDDGGQFAGTGPLTVTGAGVVFLDNQAFGFSGNVNVNGGTLRLARNSVLGTAPGRTLTVAGTGAVLDLNNAALILPLNVVLNGTGISNAGALIGTATVNLASGVTLATDSSVGGTNTLTLSGGVSGPGKLTKVGTNTVVLSGVNSYTGGTVASAGTLQAVRPFALPGYATAGQVSVAAGATLALNVGGFGEFAAADVTSALTSAAFTANATFALDTTNAAGGTFAAPAIAPSTAAVNFTKLGTGTLSLTAAGTYTGTTTILNGTVAVASGTNNTLNNGPLVLGSVGGANNALDLGATSQAFTTLRVNNSSATTGTSTITVAAGQTLSFSGNVLIGPDAPSATLPSRLNITGGGALAVATAAGGLFQVGGTNASTTTGQVLDNATLDLTGLGSVNINVSATGTVRVNNAMNANTAGVQSTLLMPTPAVPAGTAVTTILANNLNVGDNGSNGNGAGQVNALVLGTGLTTLNVNNLNVGTGGRDLGTLTFANANGTLTLQGAASTPTSRTRAAVNVGTGGASTGVAPGTGVTNVVDLSGHDADLFVSTLTIGSQNRNTDRTDTVTFNTGTLNATGVVIGSTSGTANGTVSSNTFTSTLNLGGGSVTIGASGLDIASTATAATGTDTIAATVNISGGSVSVANNPAAGFAAAVRIGQNSNAAAATANGTLNISGGSVTVAGNIVRGATTGPGSATLALTGGVLDMSGKNVGASGAPLTTLTFAGGTLRNLGSVFQNLTQTGGTSVLDVLANNATVGGAYSVTGGTAAVAAGRSLNVTGTATLAGTYQVGTTATTAGVLNAGTAAGNLDLSSALDVLDVRTTEVTAGGPLVIATYATGTRTGFFDAALLNGTPEGAATVTTPGAGQTLYTYPDFTVLYDDTAKNVQLTVTSVPEPTGVALAAVGAGLLALRRRRRPARA